MALPFILRFLSNLVYRFTLPFAKDRNKFFSVAQLKVIYMHARNFTSGFLTILLKMPLNVSL